MDQLTPSAISTYFYKVRKIPDMPQFVKTRYAPDAWFLGAFGFRAYYLRSQSSGVRIGMYMTHCQEPLPRPVRGRIGILDLSENKMPAVLLIDETRSDVDD